MKTYVMSDIHGNFELYNDILTQIDFENFSINDKLYILGDVVDREKSSIKILKHIMQNSEKITMIIGNHEYMMLTEMDKYIENSRSITAKEELDASNWCMNNGGDETLFEFLQESEEKQLEILDFIRKLPYKINLKTVGEEYYLVHGRPENYDDPRDLPTDNPRSLRLKPQEYQMVWGRFPYDKSNEMKEVLIFGHTSSKYYKEFRDDEHWAILEQKNYIAIDCGVAYKAGQSRLGCLRLEDKKEFYANVKY